MSGKVDSFASRAMMSPNKGENEVDGEQTLSRLVDAPLKSLLWSLTSVATISQSS